MDCGEAGVAIDKEEVSTADEETGRAGSTAGGTVDWPAGDIPDCDAEEVRACDTGVATITCEA